MPKAQPHLMTTKRNVSDISVTSSHLLRFAFFTIFTILGLSGIYAEEEKKPALLSEAVDGEIARRQTQILEAEKIIADGDTFAESGDFRISDFKNLFKHSMGSIHRRCQMMFWKHCKTEIYQSCDIKI